MAQLPFRRPQSTEYPFDPACAEIVQALEDLGWHVPGVRVRFNTDNDLGWMGSLPWTRPDTTDRNARLTYLMVEDILGPNFRILFGRHQDDGSVAAVGRIIIPGFDITVFADGSGPLVRVYCGRDWSRDVRWFLSNSKIDARRNDEPQRYALYRGDGLSAEFVVHDTSQGREHERVPGMPQRYPVAGLYSHTDLWLRQNVLGPLLGQI